MCKLIFWKTNPKINLNIRLDCQSVIIIFSYYYKKHAILLSLVFLASEQSFTSKLTHSVILPLPEACVGKGVKLSTKQMKDGL